MLRLVTRGVGLLLLIALFVPAGFSKNWADKTDNDLETAAEVTSTNSSSQTVSSEAKTAPIATTADETVAPDATPVTAAETTPSAQDASGSKKAATNDSKPAPTFTPMLATTGTLGLFTLETADTLPKGGFAVS